MPWPPRGSSIDKLKLKREVDGLKTTICCLKRELENKQGAVGRLELLLHERLDKIDQLNATIDRLRDQNRRLDEEAERLVEIIKFDAVMLTQKLDTAELANRAGEG